MFFLCVCVFLCFSQSITDTEDVGKFVYSNENVKIQINKEDHSHGNKSIAKVEEDGEEAEPIDVEREKQRQHDSEIESELAREQEREMVAKREVRKERLMATLEEACAFYSRCLKEVNYWFLLF